MASCSAAAANGSAAADSGSADAASGSAAAASGKGPTADAWASASCKRQGLDLKEFIRWKVDMTKTEDAFKANMFDLENNVRHQADC